MDANGTSTQAQVPSQQTSQGTLPTASGTQASANASSDPANIPAPMDPLTSASDTGTSPRPRDARTIHMILSALGVAAYQERVPLQLLDFAYRYTAGILSDAQHLTAEGYSAGATGGNKSGNSDEISLDAVKLAASSRAGYQFTGGQLPKETLLEIAAERNKIKLPDVASNGSRFGLRLPHERFLLHGRNWGMNEEWESEGPGSDDGDHEEDSSHGLVNGTAHGTGAENNDEDMAEGDASEDGEGRYEDAFGADENEDGNEMMDEN